MARTRREAVFVDTWGWLALEDRGDAAHEAVTVIRGEHYKRGVVWHTTDYVLDETFTRLYRRRPFEEASRFAAGLLRAREVGAIVVEWVTEARFASACQLRVKLHDKPRISFTDLTSFVVMEELGIRQVISGDAHFSQVNMGFEMMP